MIRNRDHDRAPSGPGILFRYHDVWPRLWFGTSESLGLERGTPQSPLFFIFRHGGMGRACISTAHLDPTCAPPTSRPFILYQNVRAEYLEVTNEAGLD